MTSLAYSVGTSAVLSMGLLPAQQLQWQVPAPPSLDRYLHVCAFGDYDQDGYRDLVINLFLDDIHPTNPSTATHRIISGRDGSTLWEHQDIFRAGPATPAGDLDGDGSPDFIASYAILLGYRAWAAWSPKQDRLLWIVTGSVQAQFGLAVLGDLDVNGDGKPDFLALTSSSSESDVYVYDHKGQLLYTIPCVAQGLVAVSLGKMPDQDGDGCDDFLVGCNENTARGVVLLVSGRTGTILRQSFGLVSGDKIFGLVRDLGDLDGDGVHDYAGFPWWSAWRAIITVFSGQTGAVIRTWDAYANSAITGEDVDLDGVPDLVVGSDYPVLPPNIYGRTTAFSGRDGTELWRVNSVSYWYGTSGTSGWMESSASLGTQPGSPYPALVWLDLNHWQPGTAYGRIRSYSPTRDGQGPVSGTACTSTGDLPLIGVRQTTTGSRITIARSHPGALAALNLAFTALPTPVDLSSLGFAGCKVHVDPAASYLRVLGTSGIDRGYAAVDLPYPLAASGLGVAAVGQWLVYDPATLGYAATQKHELRLQ